MSALIDSGTNLSFTINTWSNNTSFTKSNNFKTAGANRLAVAVISYEGMASAGQVNSFSITDGSTTLTFALVSASYRIQGAAPASRQTIEIWTCQVASQFNSSAAATTVSMATSVTLDDAFVSVFSVSSLTDITNPFDPNGGIPTSAVNTSSTTPPQLTYSTTNANDLLVFVSAYVGTTDFVTPSGWTNWSNGFNGGGSLFEGQSVSYKSVGSAQTSQTVKDAAVSNHPDWEALVMAFTAPADLSFFSVSCPNPQLTRRPQPIWQLQTFPFGPPPAAPTVTQTAPIHNEAPSPRITRRHPGWQPPQLPLAHQTATPTVTPTSLISNIWASPQLVRRKPIWESPRFPAVVPPAPPVTTVQPYLFFVG